MKDIQCNGNKTFFTEREMKHKVKRFRPRNAIHAKMGLFYNKITGLSIEQFSGNPGPEVIKLFPCSTQLSIKLIMVINVKYSNRESVSKKTVFVSAFKLV